MYTKKKSVVDAFKKANKARKRVMIARDVLAQLDAKKLLARSGYFVKFNKKQRSISGDKEVCDITSKVPCQVCGIGSLFVAAVEFNDKLKVNETDFDDDGYREGFGEETTFDYLEQFFDEDQLNEIESAFENGDGARHSHDAANFCNIGVDNFDEKVFISDYEVRMRLIMENIIANKGTFRADIRPVPVEFKTPGFKG